jgi:hypothetical protein
VVDDAAQRELEAIQREREERYEEYQRPPRTVWLIFSLARQGFLPTPDAVTRSRESAEAWAREANTVCSGWGTPPDYIVWEYIRQEG